MAVGMCLNELSLANWYGNYTVAKAMIDKFVAVAIVLTRAGAENVMLSPSSLLSTPLSGSLISKWLNDQNVDKEKIRF